jgi:hypothetical protein
MIELLQYTSGITNCLILETCYYVRLRLLSHHQVHYTSRQPLDKLDGRTW